MEDIIFEELSDNEFMTFYTSLKNARLINNHGYYVDLEELNHYKNTKNFLIKGNIGGYAIENGNLIAVHKNPLLAKESNVGHIMHSLMLSALSHGAKKLDCYGDFLCETYMQYGFLPVGKMKFNREYNPSWPYQEEPNVYVMLKAVRNLEELVKHQRDNSFLHIDEIEDTLPVFDDYDKLMQLRDKILEQVESKNFSYEQIVEKLQSEELYDE